MKKKNKKKQTNHEKLATTIKDKYPDDPDDNYITVSAYGIHEAFEPYISEEHKLFSKIIDMFWDLSSRLARIEEHLNGLNKENEQDTTNKQESKN